MNYTFLKSSLSLHFVLVHVPKENIIFIFLPKFETTTKYQTNNVKQQSI